MLLHDVGSGRHEWQGVAPQLAGAYRVLGRELRGHGDSEHWPRQIYNVEACVEDHDDLVPVFNAQSEVLTERYGEFFIAELIEAQDDRNRGKSDSDDPSIPL